MLYDQFYSVNQKAEKFHSNVLLPFKIFEFASENLELVFFYFLGLDVILSVQDILNWCYCFKLIPMIGFDNTVLQIGSCFEIFDFSMSKLSAIFSDALVTNDATLLVPTCSIK